MTTFTPNSIAAARTGWPAWLAWIRPWYVGAVVTGGLIEGHIYPDCSRLARATSEPQQGAGWLDPDTGAVCGSCLARHHNGEEQPA